MQASWKSSKGLLCALQLNPPVLTPEHICPIGLFLCSLTFPLTHVVTTAGMTLHSPSPTQTQRCWHTRTLLLLPGHVGSLPQHLPWAQRRPNGIQPPAARQGLLAQNGSSVFTCLRDLAFGGRIFSLDSLLHLRGCLYVNLVS